MFEQWDDGLPDWAADPSTLDGPVFEEPVFEDPELTEDDYDAMVEELLAADPENRPAPTAAEVIARGESAPVTLGLIARLWQLDPAAAGENDSIGLGVAWDRVANAVHARRTLAVARAIDTSPDGVQVPRELHASAQLGAALGLGAGAADTLVSTAIGMQRLPTATAMALDGDLTFRKASSLATATLPLTADQARQVEDRVLAKARLQAPSRFDAAVRRAVELIDPDGADDRAAQRRQVVRLVRHHFGDGSGQLVADLPSEKIEVIWLAADRCAIRRKHDGDPRTLDQLRGEAIYQWAGCFLSHADPTICQQYGHTPPPAGIKPEPWPEDWPVGPTDEDDSGDDEPNDGGTACPSDDQPNLGGPGHATPVESQPSVPAGHGRDVMLSVVWDLTSLVGLTRHCGLLPDTDTPIAPSAVEDLIAGGLRVRRGVLDGNGWIADLTPKTWLLPATDGRSHPQPVELLLTTKDRLEGLSADIHQAIDELDAADAHLAAVLRELLDFPLTAGDLDKHPGDEKPGPALAAFVCVRAGHPVNPAAGPTSARAGDIDHHEAQAAGGPTTRVNLGPLTRRWHRIKTFDDWTVKQVPEGWEWASPTGRKYLQEPFDYRLGP